MDRGSWQATVHGVAGVGQNLATKPLPPLYLVMLMLGVVNSTFAVVQSLSLVHLFVVPWTAACQASLCFTVSWSLLKFMSTELMMLSNHLILCHPLLLLPSVFPSIRVYLKKWEQSLKSEFIFEIAVCKKSYGSSVQCELEDEILYSLKYFRLLNPSVCHSIFCRSTMLKSFLMILFVAEMCKNSMPFWLIFLPFQLFC